MAVQPPNYPQQPRREFANDSCGHKALIAWPREHKVQVASRWRRPADAGLASQLDLLTGIPGSAQISALQLLGELNSLSAGMSARQWVAHSGFDPAHRVSGTSLHKPSRISRAGNKHLRRALFMPALVAVRHDPHLKAFYQALLARHKAKMQSLIAVARKLLHAIFRILHTHTPYDGNKLFPHLIPV